MLHTYRLKWKAHCSGNGSREGTTGPLTCFQCPSLIIMFKRLICLKHKVIEKGRERQKKIFHLPFYSSKVYSTCTWARLKSGSQNSIWIFHIVEKRTYILGHCSLHVNRNCINSKILWTLTSMPIQEVHNPSSTAPQCLSLVNSFWNQKVLKAKVELILI